MSNTNHRIKVSLDFSSSGLNSFLSKIQNSLNKGFSGFTNTFSPNALQTAEWISGFNVIQQAGSAAFSAIGTQIKAAMDLQTDLISSANAYQTVLGLNFKEAKDLASQANKIFEKSTIGLPFDEFGRSLRSALSDDVLGAFYDKNNVEGSLKRTSDLLSRIQVLVGGTVGTTGAQKLGLTQDILSGDYNKIQSQEAFRNNAQFSRTFEELVKGLGGKDSFNKLNKQERVSFLERLSQEGVTDEVVSEYGNTLSSFLGKFNVLLFGSQGLFSFTRELIPNLPGSDLLSSITGFFRELSSTFAFLAPAIAGFIDPFIWGMKLVFDGLTVVLTPLNMLLKQLDFMVPALYVATAALSTFFIIGLSKYLLLNRAAIVGGAISKGGFLLNFLGIPSLGQLKGLTTFFSARTVAGAKGISLALKGLTFASIGASMSTISTAASGLIPLFGTLTASASGLFATLLPLIANPLVLGIAAIIAGIGFAVWKWWKPISQFFLGVGDAVANEFEPVVQIFGWLGDQIKRITGALSPLTTKLKQVSSSVGKFFGSQVEASGGERAAGQSFGSSAINLFRWGPLGVLKDMIWGNKADGNVFGAIAGILNESKVMPTGSFPVIANSSEVILNRGQQQQLASNYYSRGMVSPQNRPTTSGSSSFNPTFNFNFTGNQQPLDEDKVVALAIQAFEDAWNKTKNALAY